MPFLFEKFDVYTKSMQFVPNNIAEGKGRYIRAMTKYTFSILHGVSF